MAPTQAKTPMDCTNEAIIEQLANQITERKPLAIDGFAAALACHSLTRPETAA